MGFILSKIILFLVLPPSSLIIVMALGFLLVKRHPRLAKVFIVAGFSILYLISIRPVSDALIKPLESSFSPLVKDSALIPANTIVVLTGGAVDLSWLGISPRPSKASLSRLIYGMTLYRQIPGATIVISGGSGDFEKQNISEADAMKDIAVSLDFPPKDILIEKDSRNTIESVRELNKLIGNKKITLVTSAYHMKRAAAMFKKIGMDIVPAPTDYISEQKTISLYSFIPRTDNLATSTVAFYEYMSFAWYRINGNV
ncbi:MAG: YdcF family protein [Deltaproteobacteria bacterium]|nr:YdcF family protein [Deltaproteobacteria bacterium]